MANVDMTSVSSLLKEVYEPSLVSLLYEGNVVRNRITASSEGVKARAGGHYIDFPVVTRRNQGISYRSAGAALGNPGRSAYDEVHVTLKYGYARARFDGQVFELASEDYQAFTDSVDQEFTLLKDSVRRDECRQFYGDTKGVLATAAASTGPATTVTVDTVWWLDIDMEVDVVAVATGTPVAGGSGLTITDIDPATKVVTLSGAVTVVSSTHGMVRAGNYNKEINGFASIIKNNTTALHDIDPADTAEWASTVESLGGAISENAMIKKIDQVRAKGGDVSAIFCSQGVRRAYTELLRADRTINDTLEFAGGISGVKFRHGKDIPVFDDPDCPSGHMYFVSEKQMSIRHARDWAFDDKDGSMFKWVSGYDAYDVLYKRYWEMFTHRRNSHALLYAITES